MFGWLAAGTLWPWGGGARTRIDADVHWPAKLRKFGFPIFFKHPRGIPLLFNFLFF